jgi:hypothetical protein
MKSLFATLTFILSLSASFSTLALTEKDCRERVNNAMYNSDRLGGNDKDAYRWAQNAANECFKEIAQNKSSGSTYSSKPNTSSDSGSGASIFFILLILGGIGYLIFRPRLATEGEARATYKKIAELYKTDPSDSEAMRNYKNDVVNDMSEGLNYLIDQIKKKDQFITQYFLREMVADVQKDLKKREQEIRENGKIKVEISRKICRDMKCRSINLPDANHCEKCGKPLPTVDEIVANIEKHDALERIEKKLIDEQNTALQKSLKDFGLLIENRARSLDESQLARVCQAYVTGKLAYHSPQYFDHSDRDKIYTKSTSDGLFDDVNFPVDRKNAEQIAIDAIKSILTKSAAKKGKEKLWEDKVRKIYGWASFFAGENTGDVKINSSLYKTIKVQDPGLLKNMQIELAKWQAETHARLLSGKKQPYSSA